MKRTIPLFYPERYTYADGTTEAREEVTVTPFAKTMEHGHERTVWVDIDGKDDGCGPLYTLECGRLWPFEGEYHFD